MEVPTRRVALASATCLVLMILSAAPRASAAATSLVDMTVHTGFTPWASPTSGYTNIQVRLFCQCTNRPGPILWIQMESWYTAPVTVDWTVGLPTGKSFSGSTPLSTPGEPFGLTTTDYVLSGYTYASPGETVSFLFTISGVVSTIFRFDNSFPYSSGWMGFKPIPTTPGSPAVAQVQVECVGVQGPRPGHWIIQWQDLTGSGVDINWRAFNGSNNTAEAHSTTISAGGGFSQQFSSDLPCQPPPWDGGISFTVQSTGSRDSDHPILSTDGLTRLGSWLPHPLGYPDSRLTLSAYTRSMPEAQKKLAGKIARVLLSDAPKFKGPDRKEEVLIQ